MRSIFLTLFLKLFLLTSCTIKTNLKDSDLEEIYHFKSKSVLAYNESNELIKEFLIFDFVSSSAKKKALEECRQYILNKTLKNVNCKIKFLKITNKIATSLN